MIKEQNGKIVAAPSKTRQNPQETQGFSRVLVRPERFELPAFWSVGALTVSKRRFPLLFGAVELGA